jgi:tetratricopeptide (TPR) repeat protein
MTSDPALESVGVGLAQGNHPEHEAGSIAVALLVAAPQKAHEAERGALEIPPPKAVPSQRELGRKGSAVDRAWIATLTGSHRRAARLFKQAYKKSKDPQLLYEAARAHARDGNIKAALSEMKKYSGLVEGEDKIKALDMVARLELGETIFATSKEEKMSTETKRFFVIGQRLFEQGEWDGAIDAFQQAYTYTKHPDIIYNIGLTHLRAGRVGEALRFFDEYQRHVPEASNVGQARQLFDIGLELYKAGQFEAASRHFAMTYAFMAFPELVYNLALCHKAMGENDKAVRFLREFLDTDPPEKDRAEAQKMIDDLVAPAP